jgi:hypothetical protein
MSWLSYVSSNSIAVRWPSRECLHLAVAEDLDEVEDRNDQFDSGLPLLAVEHLDLHR